MSEVGARNGLSLAERRRIEENQETKEAACTGIVGVRTFKAVADAAKMAANDNGDIV